MTYFEDYLGQRLWATEGFVPFYTNAQIENKIEGKKYRMYSVRFAVPAPPFTLIQVITLVEIN